MIVDEIAVEAGRWLEPDGWNGLGAHIRAGDKETNDDEIQGGRMDR